MNTEKFHCVECDGAGRLHAPWRSCIQCNGTGVLIRETDDSLDRSRRFSMIVTDLWSKGGPPQVGYDHLATEWAQEGGYMRPWVFQNDELEQLICGGYAEIEIAKELRRSKDGVRHQLRKLGYATSYDTNTRLFMALATSGIKPRRCADLIGHCVGEKRWPATNDDKELIRLYDEVGASNAEIAIALEVKPQTVGRWRRDYEIPRPVRRKLTRVQKDARSRIISDGAGGIA